MGKKKLLARRLTAALLIIGMSCLNMPFEGMAAGTKAVLSREADTKRKRNQLYFGNCSVHSQLRAKIHLKSPSAMGFLLARSGFLTVSAASALTY